MSGRRGMDGQLNAGGPRVGDDVKVQATFAIEDDQAAKSEAVLVLVDRSGTRQRAIALPTTAGELGKFALLILERLHAIGAPVPDAFDREILGDWCELEGADELEADE